MPNLFKKMHSRIDLYASHCYGRIKSCIPLSLFYTSDGLAGGRVKAALKPFLGGKIPALITFSYYAYSLIYKAKESYDTHPDAMNIQVETEKLIDTSSMIINKLRQHKNDACLYLKKQELSISDAEIDKLILTTTQGTPTWLTTQTNKTINSNIISTHITERTALTANSSVHDDTNETTLLNLYDMFHELHNKIHPHTISYYHNFLDSILHAITHLNEYLLLKYFAEIDLLDFTEPPVIGLIILSLALLSAYQTFIFNLQPKKPSSDEVLNCITQDFRLFRDNRRTHFFVSVDTPSEETAALNSKVKELALYDRTQKCYMSSHS